MSAPGIFSDEDMAKAIEMSASKGHDVLVVANGFTAVLAERLASTHPWLPLGRGDFGLKCGVAAKVPAKAGRLWWQDVVDSPVAADLSKH